MMTGLGYLMVVSYFIKRQNPNENKSEKFDIFKMGYQGLNGIHFYFSLVLLVLVLVD